MLSLVLQYRSVFAAVGRIGLEDADCEARGSAVQQGPTMATILAFRQDQRSNSRAAGNGLGRPAEIVFFPGVRYERTEDTPRQRNKRRQRRRDRLEIAGSDH